jgi:hypothetical protein
VSHLKGLLPKSSSGHGWWGEAPDEPQCLMKVWLARTLAPPL